MLTSRINKIWKRISRGYILGKYPPPPGEEETEALILVVGSDTEYKNEVALALAIARGATTYEFTKAGVGIFTRAPEELTPPPVVINTVPLPTAERWRPVDTARMWVTQNSLRKLSGKLVFVVCVYQQTDFKLNMLSWLHVLACIFEKHEQKIMILVHSEDNADEVTKLGLRNILKLGGFTRSENITFANLRKSADLIATILLELQHTSFKGIADAQSGRENRRAMAPFLLPCVAPNASKKKTFGPWGPEKVFLFGRSGSGKSTLAQMLTLGRLDAHSESFLTSSSMRGGTRMVVEGQGRGWHVIDTPGLAEVDDYIVRRRFGITLKDVQLARQTDSRIIFVWRKSRLDQLDELLWELFVYLVGAELIQHRTTVVVSDADEDWLEHNVNALKESFEGCENFLAVDFPPADPDDAFEAENQKVRLESLKALEDGLASLSPLGKLHWSTGVPRSPMAHVSDSLPIRETGAPSASALISPPPEDPLPGLEHYERGLTAKGRLFMVSMVSICVVHLRADELRKKLEDKMGTPENLHIVYQIYQKERAKSGEHQQASGNDSDPVLKRASEVVFSAQDFRRVIEVGREDGYFVSSKWLLDLEEHEKENLMSVLRRAGYSETRQTCTTILFARIEIDGQSQVPYDSEPKSSRNVDKIGAPKEDNDLLDIRHLNIDKSAAVADLCGSDNLPETRSSIDREIKTFDSDGIFEEISPAAGEQRGPMLSKSFQSALDSKGHRTFCVSTEWLSNLKADEKKALEAGYEKIHETNAITWYEQIACHTKNSTGEGTSDNDSSKSSSRNDIAGNAAKKPATSEGGRRTQNLDGEDHWRGSPSVENTKETRPGIQDLYSTCHSQLLSVSCSSSSQTPTDLSPRFGCKRRQFGGTIVKMPGTARSRSISTTIEKPFQLQDVIAANQRPQEVIRNLKARASTTLSCCVSVGDHPPKVRLKIYAISGDVENEETEEEEEMGNFFILRSFYTTVYGCVRNPTNSNLPIDQINLNIEDEYIHNQERRVHANAEKSEARSTDSGDYVWLEMSQKYTDKWESGSTTLALCKSCKTCEKNEPKRPDLKSPDSLYFRDSKRPAIFEGDIEEFLPNSFLEFHIRYTLEIHYFKILREIGPVASAKHLKKAISFDCYLEMRTEGIQVHIK